MHRAANPSTNGAELVIPNAAPEPVLLMPSLEDGGPEYGGSKLAATTSDAVQQRPRLLVFSGGTAFNTIAGHMRHEFPCGVYHIFTQHYTRYRGYEGSVCLVVQVGLPGLSEGKPTEKIRTFSF
jgi:hypothetical protein